VLPFENISDDPEQEYFADGMVEEIITALSPSNRCSSSLGIRALRSKAKPEVGRRLRVRYVFEGSVRKASGKVRITGQLIDAVTGAHIWADRIEHDFADIFSLQDEVTVAVVSAKKLQWRRGGDRRTSPPKIVISGHCRSFSKEPRGTDTLNYCRFDEVILNPGRSFVSPF
jgi:TolB-like protein